MFIGVNEMSYYFDKETDTLSDEKTIKVNIFNSILSFRTDNNVFSKNYLDYGTRTLLESLDLNDIKGDVLDFGCGYGPIGIIIKKNCNCNVDMIDINLRALSLAQKNAQLNNVSVNIFESDVYSNIEKKYDYIISNPPIRVGKKILYEILVGALDHLKKDGHLIIVINKDQGAKSTIKYLEKYYDISVICKNKGFYIIDCQNY